MLHGVQVRVVDCTNDLASVSQKSIPTAFDPRRGDGSICSSAAHEGMEGFAAELSRCGALQYTDEILNSCVMPIHNDVHMIPKDGACEKLNLKLFDHARESPRDALDLLECETNHRILQCRACFTPKLAVERSIRKRPALIGFRGRPESLEVRSPNFGGPRSALVVGQPEAVGAPDRVKRENHVSALSRLAPAATRGKHAPARPCAAWPRRLNSGVCYRLLDRFSALGTAVFGGAKVVATVGTQSGGHPTSLQGPTIQNDIADDDERNTADDNRPVKCLRDGSPFQKQQEHEIGPREQH